MNLQIRLRSSEDFWSYVDLGSDASMTPDLPGNGPDVAEVRMADRNFQQANVLTVSTLRGS
jgi:hypothetical protein